MPAEWEHHEATWLSWPKDPETFPGEILRRVEGIYIQMISALAKGEKVHILAEDDAMESKILGMLEKAEGTHNVVIHKIATIDVWMRDYGPIFVKGEELKITKWTFNAWGGKYEDLMLDDSVVDKLLPFLNMEIIRPGIVLEGGSIDVNGKGSLLTTKQCLLNKNRNPTLSKGQIEAKLKENLGVSNVIWLDEGVAGDDTDGHIDDIARFVGPRKVLCAMEDNPSDQNHNLLKKNLETLKGAKDQDGEALVVVPLPMPGIVNSPYGRLPASYANFYIGNDAVLLPIFNHANDEKAISLLAESFPERKVVPIFCEPLVWGLGGIHCVTQQQPGY